MRLQEQHNYYRPQKKGTLLFTVSSLLFLLNKAGVMKMIQKIILLIVGLTGSLCAKKIELQDLPKDLITFDQVKAVIHGVNGTTIVTESATKRAGLDGAIQTLDGLVFEGLVLQEAEGKYKKVGVVPDDEAVEKHLDKVKKDNNLSEDDLTRIFKESGYANYAEGFQKFKDMVTANSMLSFQAGKITVPERDVAAYCEAHPQMEEANFFIERGTVPAGEFKNTKELNNALKAARDNKKELDGVTWTSPFWLKKSDTAEEKAFIFDLKEGQHSSAHPLEDGGFEIYKVLQIKPERLRSIQERYHEVADILRRPLQKNFLDEYKKHLFENASVIYF